MNNYLEFYEKYKISPVVQDIENFTKHIKRRTNLYRQISVTPLTFQDKDILEIGPGGGYNSLVTYTYMPKTYTFIEPNSTGYQELKEIFKHIDKGNLFMHNCTLEDFTSTQKYDIIMCEGLIPGLNNKEEFIMTLVKLLKPNGIFIITTADQITMFFEILRRHIANILIKDIDFIEEKVKILVNAFSSHLNTLKGMTRNHEDWCLDNLINDATYQHTFSINDAIDLIKNNFYVLGTSPNLFNNYTWYKELPIDILEYNNMFQKQFLTRWHNLIDYRFSAKDRDSEKNIQLSQYCLNLISLVKNSKRVESIRDCLLKIKENLNTEVDNTTILSIDEVIDILSKEFTAEDINNMKYFTSAFGRGQSYISFVKENEDLI